MIVGVVVLIAFGIYSYSSDVGLSPRVGTSERVAEINILDSFERGVSPSPKDVPKLERIAKSGALSGAQRAVARGFDACDADLDKNGVVDNGDLLIVVGDWGCLENGGGNETNGTISCSGEINGDGLVGTNDLLIVLDNWGESCVSPLPDFFPIFVDITDGDETVELSSIPLKDGIIDLGILFGNGTVFEGIGEREDRRLATSADSTLEYFEKKDDSSYHNMFVASSSSGESYVLSMNIYEDIADGRNETNIRNEITGETVAHELVAGDVFNLGDVSFEIADLGTNLWEGKEWANITADNQTNFHKVFTNNGLEMNLPIDCSTFGPCLEQGGIWIGEDSDFNLWFTIP